MLPKGVNAKYFGKSFEETLKFANTPIGRTAIAIFEITVDKKIAEKLSDNTEVDPIIFKKGTTIIFAEDLDEFNNAITNLELKLQEEIMLKAKALIEFGIEGKTYEGDLTGEKLRPAFNFGNNLLFSGAIVSKTHEYMPKQQYEVDILFFTIYDSEGYNLAKPLMFSGKNMAIQTGKWIIGIAKIIDYTFEDL